MLQETSMSQSPSILPAHAAPPNKIDNVRQRETKDNQSHDPFDSMDVVRSNIILIYYVHLKTQRGLVF